MIDLTSFSNDSAAAPVLAMIREGRWRKARDAAKELCKRDRAKFLPLLIAANFGLAHEMQAKGLVKDAATVLEYLKTIAPAAVWEPILAKLAAPSPKPASTLTTNHGVGKSSGADWWAATVRVDEISLSGGNPDPEDLAAVDLLVPDAFIPVIKTTVSERSSILEKELTSVRQACDATGAGQWDVAREFLRELPRQSVFRHWRMFLRGVACFFNDDFATARQCFATLPPQGALAMAARTIDPTLAPVGELAPPGVQIPFFLAATNQPSTWAPTFLKANIEVKEGKRLKALKTLEAGLKGKFPTEKIDLPGELTRGLLPFTQNPSFEEQEQSADILDYFTERYSSYAKTAQDVSSSIYRPFSLTIAGQESATMLNNIWRICIAYWNRSEGPNPERDSIAWEWLGNTLSNHQPSNRFIEIISEPRSSLPLAKQAFDEAVKCFPENESAWLSLLDVIAKLNDVAAHDALMDKLVKRFPNNKNLLLRHGSTAIKQSDFAKGLTSLHAALKLDPLDPNIRAEIVRTLVIQKMVSSPKDLPAAPWEPIKSYLDPRPYPSEWFLSRWLMHALQAALEPETKTAKLMQAEVVSLAPSSIEYLFVELLFGQFTKSRRRKTWSAEWEASIASQDLNWPLFSKLLELHCFASKLPTWSASSSKKVSPYLKNVLKALLKDKTLKAPDALLAFLDEYERLLDLQNTFTAESFFQCIYEIEGVLEHAASPRKKKADPRLRMATMLLREFLCYYRQWEYHEFDRDITVIRNDAIKLGLTDVVNRVEAICTRYSMGPPAWKQEEDFDDDDEGYDEDGYDESMEDPICIVPSRKKIESHPPPTDPPPAAQKKPKASKKSANPPIGGADHPELF